MDKRIKIIGLTGKARSGKDTAARCIHQHILNHTATVDFEYSYALGLEAFAAPLKSMVAMLLDFFGKGEIMNPATLQPYIDGELKEELIPEIGASPRKLLQTLGTEWGRQTIKDDIWIACMLERIKKYSMILDHGFAGVIIVITDVRFDNEATALKELGATLVEIKRDDVPDVVGDAPHGSEAGVSVDMIDRVVYNNGTLEEFAYELVDKLSGVLPTYPDAANDPVYELPWDAEDATEGDTESDEDRPAARS